VSTGPGEQGSAQPGTATTQVRRTSLARSLAWFAGPYGVAIVGYLLLNAAAARFLGRDDLGAFVVAMTAASLVGQIGLFGVHRSGLREAARLAPDDMVGLGRLRGGVTAVSVTTLPACAIAAGAAAYWITQDRGYKPAEMQESYSIGEIPIDAIYTPIERVNFVVEHTRVGPMTDYDRLIIEVLTDGTIEPDDALAEAARTLMTQAQVFAAFTQGEGDQAETGGLSIPEEVLNKPLADLGLSPRVLNALRSRQIERVGQVLTIDPEQLLSIRNFGPRSMTELRQKLAEFGYLPEGDVGLGSGEYLDGLEEEEDELDGDLLAVSDDELAEAVASLRGAGVASGDATGEEDEA